MRALQVVMLAANKVLSLHNSLECNVVVFLRARSLYLFNGRQ